MNYQVNEVIQGTVTRILPYGAMMVFEDETMGLLHISEVSNDFIRNIYRYLHVGSIYQVKILSVDEEKKFLKVSLKKVTNEEKRNLVGLNDRIKAKINSEVLTNKLDEWIKMELINIKKEEDSHVNS